PALAADMAGYDRIYCIICDAQFHRVWVAPEPARSRIHYLVPCEDAFERLRLYGVPRNRITLTGFPLPPSLLGGRDLSVLRKDAGERLRRLDPTGIFWS